MKRNLGALLVVIVSQAAFAADVSVSWNADPVLQASQTLSRAGKSQASLIPVAAAGQAVSVGSDWAPSWPIQNISEYSGSREDRSSVESSVSAAGNQGELGGYISLKNAKFTIVSGVPVANLKVCSWNGSLDNQNCDSLSFAFNQLGYDPQRRMITLGKGGPDLKELGLTVFNQHTSGNYWLYYRVVERAPYTVGNHSTSRYEYSLFLLGPGAGNLGALTPSAPQPPVYPGNNACPAWYPGDGGAGCGSVVRGYGSGVYTSPALSPDRDQDLFFGAR